LESEQFDALVRRLFTLRSRRSTLAGAISALVAFDAGQAHVLGKPKGPRRDGANGRHDPGRQRAHADGKSGHAKTERHQNDGRAGAEACIPTGKPCPSKKPRGKRHKHKLTLGCDQCCQATFVTAGDGSKRCACKQNGIACETSAHCCSGICSSGACIAREGCGDTGERCCAGGACVDGSICDLSTNTCIACGGSEQPCCASSTCSGGFVCDTTTGICKACGDAGEACCASNICDENLICGEGNVCVACGGIGDACCAGDGCGAGATCFDQICYPCGGEGELCCAGDTCGGDLACDPTFGTCEATCVPLGEACTGPSGLPCCTDVNPNAQCASTPPTCQDCNQPPTAEGSLCQFPPRETCCGGRATCVSAIRNEDSVPVCIQFAQCAFPCTTNADCSGVPNNPICVKIPDPDTCCIGQPAPRTAICAQPCPVG
jgi:hypothetical protein